MKKINLPGFLIYAAFIPILLFSDLSAQGLTIASGATFSLGSSTLTLTDNWNNNGTFNAGDGTVLFNGSGTQTIICTQEDIFYDLTVNKTSNNVQLLNDIIINGTLTLSSGDFDINSNLLTLGSAASLVETQGNILIGGEATTTRILNAPNSVNIMGAEITSSEDLGSTVITRGYGVHVSHSNSSILRYYEITPSNNTDLNATLVFHYDEDELNSLTESELILFHSTNSGTDWQTAGGTVNTGSNTVTITGLSGFSLWTLGGSSSPLPVELNAFNVSSERLNSIIKWTTATEVNNYGFEVERKAAPLNPPERGTSEATLWGAVGFVKGNGNSNTLIEYEFIDKHPSPGVYLYRLKQLDNDGTFTYSDEIKVEVGLAPEEFNLAQNYPNPFNPETMIEFTLHESGYVVLKVYNTLGEETATLFNQFAEAGKYYNVKFDASGLPSGIYYARLQSGNSDKQMMRKMLLLK